MGCSIEELLAAADLLRACQERLLYLDFYATILGIYFYFSLAEEKNTANKEMFVYYSCFRRDDRPIYFVVLPLYLLQTIVILKLLPMPYETLYENIHCRILEYFGFSARAEKDPKDVPCIPLTFKRIQRRKHAAIFISWIFCIFLPKCIE